MCNFTGRVSIMKSVEYNKIIDEIEGFEDLG